MDCMRDPGMLMCLSCILLSSDLYSTDSWYHCSLQLHITTQQVITSAETAYIPAVEMMAMMVMSNMAV